MDAVLGVDLQAWLTGFEADDLVDTCRAITLGRLGIFGEIDVDRDVRVLQFQVNRLVFFVIGRGNEHRGQFIEGQDAVIFRIDDRLALGGRFDRMGVGLAVLQRAHA